jgi:hypothetical protein
MTMQWWRLGGVAGIVWFVLMLIGVLVLQGSAPVYDDPIADIRAYWVDDGQQYLVGDYLAIIGFALFFLPFLVVLRSVLGRAEGGEQLCSRLAYLGGLVLLIFGAVASTFWGVLAFGDFAATASDEMLQTLMLLDLYAFHGATVAFTVLAVPASFVIMRTGVLWKWLAIPGGIIGVIAALAPLGVLSSKSDGVFDILWFISLPAALIWLLLVSIAMVMRKDEPMAV